MRLMRYIPIISLLLWLSSTDVLACSGPFYEPGEYFMFRLVEQTEERTSDDTLDNCAEWQRLTSTSIPITDIKQVVYKMSLQEYYELYTTGNHNGNSFARWIVERDEEIKEFLLLAKINENIRFHRTSRWYYPSMRIFTEMTLEEVVEKSLASTSKRLRDRYLLQAVRALITLGEYEECVKLWEREASLLPKENFMRKMIQPYIAGAESHLGHEKKMLQYFAELNDYSSMHYCAGMFGKTLSDCDVIEIIYQHNPQSEAIPQLVNRVVHKLEDWVEPFYKDEDAPTKEQTMAHLLRISLRMAQENKCSEPAMWYYTAAFVANMQENLSEALRLLSLAENARGGEFIKESIKVLRIYLDAKTMPYNNIYEQRLYTQLQWLDNKIKDNITLDVEEKTTSQYYEYLRINRSYYYWNDIMRRILLAEVCPRMVKAGNTTRAAQLANMADNRLLGICNKHLSFDYKHQEVVEVSLDQFRRDTNAFNPIDYSNNFFKLIDSLSLDKTLAYYTRVKSPKSDFDRFLNARGYTDKDYLNDIVGTQCLRNMRYADAVKYLSAVDKSFSGHLNVQQNQPPFEITYQRDRGDFSCDDFRYNFAKEMVSLEHEMQHAIDPNKRAMAMARFAVGLRNSFGFAWELTQYYRSREYLTYWLRSPEKQAAERRVEELLDTACELATDREIAAQIQYSLCNFREVATQYADTKYAKIVWGQCDKLIDYHAERQGL